ncbi:MAG TPA: hypothetical protein VKZ18_02875 [Polyangia bacterium]|nr:hypothetical protein [Polyangia bacterium]
MVVLAGAAGCSKSLDSPDGGGGGGLDEGVPNDPAACGCQVSGTTLTMSWDCYCATFANGCTPAGTVAASCAYGTRQITRGCGLTEVSIDTVGGPERWVYDDATGMLVGEQVGTDDGQFACPTAPSVVGFSVRAGQFPDGCLSAVTCQCNADGGGCDPTDGGPSATPF